MPLKRDIYFVLASRAVRTFPFGYLSVIIPIYLAATHSALLLGSFFSVSILSSMAMLLLLSFMGHLVGVRWLLILQMLTVSATLMIMTFTSAPPLLIVAAAISLTNWAPGGGSGAGGGPYNTTLNLVLAQKSDLRSRTVVLTASAVVGSVTFAAGSYFLAFTKSTYFEILQSLFAFAALLQIAGVIIFLLGSRSITAGINDSAGEGRASLLSIVKAARSFVSAEFLNGFGQGIFQRLIPLWFFLRFAIGTDMIGEIIALAGVITAFLVIFAPALEGRLGSANSVFSGRMAYAVLVVAMSLSPSLLPAILLYYLSLFGSRVAAPIQQSLVFAKVDPSEWTRASGMIAVGSSIGSSIGALVGAILILDVNLEYPFLIAAPFLVVSALIYRVSFASRKVQEPLGAHP